MAIDSAIYSNNTSADIGNLFPDTMSGGYRSIPVQWNSPLTFQWLGQTSVKHIESEMLLLAGFMHRWLATFLDGDNCELVPTKEILEDRASIRQMIENFVPGARPSAIEAEAMYDCCRWASLILLKVENLNIPIHVAARHVRIKPRLVRLLRMTDLSNLWGIHKGLLFWVAATCHFSTAGQCFPLLCTTVLAQFAQEMAMSECSSEIAIVPLRRLKQFEKLCCRSERTISDTATYLQVSNQG
jgi:hypothetical protein